MPTIKLTALGGLEPSVEARALPDNGAQVANNLNPGNSSTLSISQPEMAAQDDSDCRPKRG